MTSHKKTIIERIRAIVFSGCCVAKRHVKLKPGRCCEMGSYEHQVPMPICGRSHGIDLCIADLVAALNAANIATKWSCCGHGKLYPVIGLKDGRLLIVREESQWMQEEARKLDS